MKKKFIIGVAILTAITANARSIDLTSAKTIASNFLGKEVQEKSKPQQMRGKFQKDSALIYILEASDGNGFVVVSGDDRTLPILAWSDHGTFDLDNAPDGAIWLISEYQKAIKALPDNKMSTNHYITTEADVAPLLSTQWGQGEPYNTYCPSYAAGQKSVTGCVATAMAQVVNYEKYSSQIGPIPGYESNMGFDLSDLNSRSFDFGNLNSDDIAWLMRYCGQSVRMDYGINESAASDEDIPEALCNYFGWPKEIRLMRRADYNDEHWDRMVAEEVREGHPLIYSGLSESGGGHTFVVDGISDDYYHVNWGWEGFADGYYSFAPFGTGDKSNFILWQTMVTTRDDDPSADVITYGTTIDGINYQLSTEDLTAAVLPLKNGEKYRGEVVIPSTVQYEGKTYTVTYLGDNCFVDCVHLTYISIPATITKQAWSIFSGCENLHAVNVEDMAAFIKIEVGGWWTGSPLTYGADLYLKGEIVKDLVIPEGIEYIDYCKFANCTSIETVTFPSTLKTIQLYGFANCKKLRKVNMLKSSLTLIDQLAFVNDISLEEVYLPESLQYIRDNAFGDENGPGCISLRKVVSLAVTPPWNLSEGKHAFSDRIYGDAELYVPDDRVKYYQDSQDWGKFIDILPLSLEKPIPAVDTLAIGPINYEINITEGYAKVIDLNDNYNGNLDIPAIIEYNGKSYPVEVIGYRAFYGISFNKFKMSAPIRKIGIDSFMWTEFSCDVDLSSATGLKVLPQRAFLDLRAPKIVLPENLEVLRDMSLANEEFIYEWYTEQPIGEIECRSAIPPTLIDNPFDLKLYNVTKLSVPFGFKKAYSSADGWCNFKYIGNSGDEEEQIADNDLSIHCEIKGKTELAPTMPLRVKCKVSNSGLNTINGFALAYSVNGSSQTIETYDVTLLANDSYEIMISIPVDVANAGENTAAIQATLNNGIIDGDTSDNSVVLKFKTLSNGFYRIHLVEQFTSEQCGLTPYQHPIITRAIERTGNTEFAVQVYNHCGYYDDFLTLDNEYEWFYNSWGTYTPAVMLNRTDIEQTAYTPVMPVSDMFEYNFLNETTMCNALISVECKVEDGNVVVKTMLEKNADFDLKAGYDYVTVFLLEDSIPARQQCDAFMGDYLTDYYHRNVLRKVLTKTWGDEIRWTDDKCLKFFKIELDPLWEQKNLSAVAFIHRYEASSPVNCQVYTAGASNLPQYRIIPDDDQFVSTPQLVSDSAETFDVYNIHGIKVRSSVKTLNDLPTGIYIANGKKIFVRSGLTRDF